MISAGTMFPATIVLSISSPYLEPGRARSRRKSSPVEKNANCNLNQLFAMSGYFAHILLHQLVNLPEITDQCKDGALLR